MGSGPAAVMVTPSTDLHAAKLRSLSMENEWCGGICLPAGIGHQSEASFIHYSAALPARRSLVRPSRLGQEEGPEEANVR